MYDDTEADFWKEHFSRLLHKNMMSTDAQRITFDNCAGIIDGFKNRHPELKPDVNFYPTYATFEIFITDTVKLRIFIQNQVKCTLLQFDEGDYVKIVDAKFPYNPFPEIEEFIENVKEYAAELENLLTKTLHTKKQLKVAGEFIKAILIKKIGNNCEVCWKLEQQKTDFKLILQKNGESKTYILTPFCFIEEIENITNTCDFFC